MTKRCGTCRWFHVTSDFTETGVCRLVTQGPLGTKCATIEVLADKEPEALLCVTSVFGCVLHTEKNNASNL